MASLPADQGGDVNIEPDTDPLADDDGDSFKEEEESDDRDELTPGTRSLNISRNYVPFLDRQDAFRELYQNW